jgi:TrmH family RNA methyltransferase
MKLLSLARDLQRRKARERQHLFVAEGIRAVEELAASPVRIVGALLSATATDSARLLVLRERLRQRAVPIEEIPERDFLSASDTESPQGILAIGEVPLRSLSSVVLPREARVLLLDALQDPGNVGTILRTAAAFGVSCTLAMPGTVDLWNAKVVRAAMGAHFHHHAASASWSDVDAFVASQDIAMWGADGLGEQVGRRQPPARLALIVGNEGSGLTAEARSRSVHFVSIPTATAVESLNVAVATGILLHHFRP